MCSQKCTAVVVVFSIVALVAIVVVVLSIVAVLTNCLHIYIYIYMYIYVYVYICLRTYNYMWIYTSPVPLTTQMRSPLRWDIQRLGSDVPKQPYVSWMPTLLDSRGNIAKYRVSYVPMPQCHRGMGQRSTEEKKRRNKQHKKEKMKSKKKRK